MSTAHLSELLQPKRCLVKELQNSKDVCVKELQNSILLEPNVKPAPTENTWFPSFFKMGRILIVFVFTQNFCLTEFN